MGKKAAGFTVNCGAAIWSRVIRNLSNGPARCWQSSRISPSAMRSVCSDIWKGAVESSCRSRKSLLTKQPKVPGLDGEKMSKSYQNVIELERRLPPRKRRSAPCRPTLRGCAERIRAIPRTARCSVCTRSTRMTRPVNGYRKVAERRYRLHRLQEAADRSNHQRAGRTPGAGRQFEEDPGLVHSILLEGSEKARDVAKETIEDVRAAIGLSS